MDVKIDKARCIGCEICVSDCIDTFQMGGDRKAYVAHQPKNNTATKHCVLSAVTHCPTDAISVEIPVQ